MPAFTCKHVPHITFRRYTGICFLPFASGRNFTPILLPFFKKRGLQDWFSPTPYRFWSVKIRRPEAPPLKILFASVESPPSPAHRGRLYKSRGTPPSPPRHGISLGLTLADTHSRSEVTTLSVFDALSASPGRSAYTPPGIDGSVHTVSRPPSPDSRTDTLSTSRSIASSASIA